MEWTFTRDGVAEQVLPERWVWGVIYTDGKQLKQFDDNGGFHQIQEIEQKRIAFLIMYRLDQPTQRIEIIWKPEYKLIHVYKRYKLNNAQKNVTVYLFGYERRSGFRTQKSLIYIFPDDRILFTDTPAETINLWARKDADGNYEVNLPTT